MKNKIDYSTRIRYVAFRHPVFSTIITQINFWVVSYLLFAVIIHLSSQSIADGTEIQQIRQAVPFFISTFVSGVIFGTVSGISEYYIFSQKVVRKSVARLILGKVFFIALTMSLLFVLMRFLLWDLITKATYYENFNNLVSKKSWLYMYFALLIYTMFMGAVISFINQVNSKYGPGVLVPAIFGKYLNPKIEERIIIFLDLKSSTAIAEKLGHIKYSKLIRDCFLDINLACIKYQAEIYQYVGDEVVLSWMAHSVKNPMKTVDFCFACRDIIESKKEYYFKEYNMLPVFKAGIHVGQITAVEVGSVKREIAFHGDTMNVTARIQEKCNEFKSHILISDTLESKIDWENSKYEKRAFNAIKLKGRKKPITIYDVFV